MKVIDKEIQVLLKSYSGDIRQILKDNDRLDYLYALSDQRELLLSWYDFDPDAELLQIGADYGAMTGLYSQRVRTVTVLDADAEALATVKLRHPSVQNVNCVQALAPMMQFDYVVLAGDGQRINEASVRDAKMYLKDGGVLILAVPNRMGMKYWAGTAREENALSKETLEKVLSPDGKGGRTGNCRFYYPMPDYRTPFSIYSDAYLPKKGDLTRVTAAYDYPRYHAMDMGEGFDVACEEGQFDRFANSYLVFWSTDEKKLYPEEDRIFVKYNKTRQDDFQISTCIGVRNGARFVEKRALEAAGIDHIASMQKKYEALEKQQKSIRLVKPEYLRQNQKGQGQPENQRQREQQERSAVVRFPYLKGETWAEKLGWQLRDGAAPVAVIRQAMEKIFDIQETDRVAFALTEAFRQIFLTDGKQNVPEEADALAKEAVRSEEANASPKAAVQSAEKDTALSEQELALLREDTACRISNIDALFENIMDTEDGSWFIDYEWVYDFPIPEHFVQYRIIYYFYEQYGSLMRNVTREGLLREFGITAEMAAIYAKLEKNFQNYVHGENQKLYLENYMFPSKGVAEMRQDESDLARARERIEQMKIHAREKDVEIHKITEVQRLTNNHVTNLEIIIGNLRHEIDEMGKTLTYLNKHEALIFKLRRKLGAKFNEKYPKGSVQRKKLRYKKEMLLHPLRYHKLYSSEEGRNLRKGDFEIGDEYREHGKLHFPKVDHPKVSIVIPVYNQIHYTYACLVSILEYTKDVTYEVIIADDVSTDATEHLAEFAEGLVICRNSTNQGFLRNCNNAAKQARGEYVMFLNNDTKVTPGWLSSLVKLIESDASIGMVGSKLVYPDGRLQEAGGIIWSDGSGWNYGRLDDPEKPEYNYVKDVDYISGAAILLSVKLWKQIGGFDDRFAPAYCEDSDLAFEVRKAGYRVVYQPLSKVIHFEGVSNGTDVQGTGLKRYQVENSKKLKEKWAAEFAKQSENNGNPDPFRARERSQGKPMILVVDHYVPTWDKDAGSKTTYQYLKMFLKKGYVVKFLGDNYLHDEPYSTELQQMGIEILYGAEYQTKIWDWLRDHGDDIEFAYLNRPHIASKYIDYILDNTDIKVIYYGHDLHFLREGREYQLTGDPKKRADAEYWKSVELSLMSKAAISYYPSYIERDAIHDIDPTISVKDITAYVFDRFMTGLNEDFAKREGLLFVGGFAHPPNADAVLWFAREIYPKIREQMLADGQEPPKFYVVGSKVTEEIKALEQPDNGIVIKGFVSEEELAHLYAVCRVVVVPLRYGAGVKGKVVEAIYNGAPIVTTSIGAEGIPQVEDVLLVEDEPEVFARKTVELYQDPEACRSLCQKTQTYIREHFSVDAAWSVIEEDFQR